jgi:hypothetical protein
MRRRITLRKPLNISLNIEQGTSNIEYRRKFRLERTFFYILTLGLIRNRNKEDFGGKMFYF